MPVIENKIHTQRRMALHLAACALALGAGAVSSAARALCVSTAQEFQQLLTDYSDGGPNAGQDLDIELVPGIYKTGTATNNGPFSYHSTAATGTLFIEGGVTNCANYSRDASLTVLDGNNASQVLNIQNSQADTFVEFVTIQNGESAIAGGGLAINTNTTGGRVYVYDDIIQNNHTASIGGGFAIDSAGSQIAAIGNLVVGNAADGGYGAGFEYSRGGSEAFVEFNTMYNNTTTASGGTGGLYCCGVPSIEPFVEANVFWQNTNYGLFLAGTPADLQYNDYGTIGGIAPAQETGSLSVDPHFVDAANSNYHLAANSALLAYCPSSTCSPLSTDLAGNHYPSAGFVDVGAYEDTIFADGFEGN